MISEATGLSIGLVLALILSIITCTVFIVRNIGSLRGRIDALTTRMVMVEGDNYTITQAEVHALRMAIANPSLRVPDPRKPGEIIVVRQGKGWSHASAAEGV